MADLECHFDDFFDRQQPLGRAVSRKRTVRHELYDDVAVIVLHRCIEQPDDVRVLQPADELGLVEERDAIHARQRAGCAAGAVKELHCDHALGEAVLPEQHPRSGALTEFAQHRVLPDVLREAGH